MAGPGLSWEAVQEIICGTDEHFEDVVNCLNMKELLDLVSGLQSAMAQEQSRFDELGSRLDLLGPDDHRAGEGISEALRSSQMKLAWLCARNMRCFTQQAERAKERHESIAADADSRSTCSTLTAADEDFDQKPLEPIGGSPVRPFQERLRFFQRQENGGGEDQTKANRKQWGSNGEWRPVEARKGEATVLDEDDGASEVTRTDNSDAISDFRALTESDFDVSDFVVHRTSFADDDDAYDSCSAVEEDTGSPVRIVPIRIEGAQDEELERKDQQVNGNTEEYEEDEGEESSSGATRTAEGSETEEETEEDFVDNSASYMSDPRRYVYYPEETELEVILEEDENEAMEDEEEEDEEDESDGKSSCTIGSVVQRVVMTLDQSPNDLRSPEEEDFKDPAEFAGISSDEENAKTNSMITSKEGNDSGVAEDHPSSNNSTAEELDEPLSTSSSIDRTCQPGPKSPSPLPRLEENTFTSHPEPPSVPPPPLPNYVPVNGTHREDVNYEEDLYSLPPQGPPPPYELKSNGHIIENGDDIKIPVKPRCTTLHWDPTDLLCELYKAAQINERSDCRGVSNNNDSAPTMEGYLETLPSGKRKATYWNAWKRFYFRVNDGQLACYSGSYSDEPRMSVQLMGGEVERLDDEVVGVDDRRGRYLTLRCQNAEEADDWFDVLSWHSQENFDATYVQPVAYPLPNKKNVIIIDLGGCSTRAGILMDQATLPQVFFPNVCATDKFNRKRVYGTEALLPHVRQLSNISFPLQPTAKITKYTIDIEAMPDLLRKIFTELNVDPRQYTIAVSVPRTLSPQTQLALGQILLEDYGVQGVNLTHQGLLTLYAYKSTSGVVVDIGDRLDIIPVSQGYIVENGITRLPYGGGRIAHHLNHTLAHKQVSLVSEVESYLLRYLLEQGCYVAQNYDAEIERFRYDPESLEKTVNVQDFFQDQPPFKSISMDFGRFHAPEGLFNPKLWGLDSPGVAKLVHKAIQECGMDVRREMARSVFLSGGVTCLPGFAQRLERELDRLTPSSVTPKVHASPYRQHMAFLGACQMALSTEFRHVCITREEWRSTPNSQKSSLLRRWNL